MRNKFLIAFTLQFFAILNINQLHAQVRVLLLTEAIDLSIKNSNRLKGSQARIEEATAALKEAVERKLPEAGLSGSYLQLNNPNIHVKSRSTNNNTPGGTTTNQDGGKPSSAIYGLLNASLPIYSGLRIRYGIESSKYLQEAAKMDADNDREAIIVNTIEAFTNLYKSHAAVGLVKETLEGNFQRVKDFSNLERNGLLPRNDLLKAQLQQSSTELSLLDAENNWKLANVNMNLLLGLPDTTVLSINETDLQVAPAQLKTVGDYVQLGLQSRKDIAALGYRKKAANTAIKAAKGGMYPSLAVTGGYIAANIPSIITVTNAVNIGLGVQYNLSSLWKNAQVEQARAKEKEVSANEEVLNDAVRLQVNQSYQSYLLSRKKIEVYQTAVVQAEENYRIVKNKFNNQLANTTDLLDADVAQLQARLNAAFAKADALVAYNRLLQTAGLLSNQVEIK